MLMRPLGARSGIEVNGIGLGLWAVPGFEWGPGEERDILEAIEVAREGVSTSSTPPMSTDRISPKSSWAGR